MTEKTADNNAPESQPAVDITIDTEITAKQKLFIAYYMQHLNGTKAAILSGYTKKNAAQTASRLLSYPNIREEIQIRMDARVAAIGKTSNFILERLFLEVGADIKDLFNKYDGTLKDVHDWPAIWRTGLVSGLEIVETFETIDDVKTKTGEVKKLKFSDKLRRIKLIGDHVKIGAFRERKLSDIGNEKDHKAILIELKGNVIGPKDEG